MRSTRFATSVVICPKDVARIVERRMRGAYRNPDPLVGQGDLEALAIELDRSHPGAAASLREGLAETLHNLSPRRAADAGPDASVAPTAYRLTG